MKVKLSSPIFDLDGTTLKVAATVVARLSSGDLVELSPSSKITLVDSKEEVLVGHKEQDMTLSHVLMETCKALLEEDKTEPAKEKFWRFEMGQLFFKNQTGSAELDIEDWVKLKERAAKVFPSAVIYGNIHALLENKQKDNK